MCRGQSDLRGGWQGRKENTARYEKNVHAAPVRRHKSEKKKKQSASVKVADRESAPVLWSSWGSQKTSGVRQGGWAELKV